MKTKRKRKRKFSFVIFIVFMCLFVVELFIQLTFFANDMKCAEGKRSTYARMKIKPKRTMREGYLKRIQKVTSSWGSRGFLI